MKSKSIVLVGEGVSKMQRLGYELGSFCSESECGGIKNGCDE